MVVHWRTTMVQSSRLNAEHIDQSTYSTTSGCLLKNKDRVREREGDGVSLKS